MCSVPNAHMPASPTMLPARDMRFVLLRRQGTSRLYTSSAIVLVVTVGISLGVLLPNETNVPQPWAVISAIVGWSFTVTWSISFYPQIFVNFQRKRQVLERPRNSHASAVLLLSHSTRCTAVTSLQIPTF